jgi:hypothetical protein
MKIIPRPVEVEKFTDINSGEIFVTENESGTVFMKLEGNCLFQKHHQANAVGLADGSFTFFDENDNIIVVHGYFAYDKP